MRRTDRPAYGPGGKPVLWRRASPVEEASMPNGSEFLRVFISSTFEALRDYRQAAFQAIHALGGYSDDMVYWSAEEREAQEVSAGRVRQCDVVILLVAHRHGFVPSGSEWSVTEAEYRTARKAQIPVLAFFLDETVPWPPAQVDWEHRERLQRFKRQIETEVTRKLFRSPAELGALVTQALAAFLERQRGNPQRRKRAAGRLELQSHVHLRTTPDLTLRIGDAEDGLPLLLAIRRSRDLREHLDSLAELTKVPGQDPPTAILDSFRQALGRHAVGAWAQERIFPIRDSEGVEREMYVSRGTLAQFGSSLLARLLEPKILRLGSAKTTPAMHSLVQLAQLRSSHRSNEDWQ